MLMTFIPDGPGLLPKWQLLIAATSFFNVLQNFVTLDLTRRVYSSTPLVTPLQARTFAVWTATVGCVRTYAAYHIHDKKIYDLTLLTYLLAFAHFGSELFIFRSIATIRGPVIFPAAVSTVSLIWMLTQYDYYVTTT